MADPMARRTRTVFPLILLLFGIGGIFDVVEMPRSPELRTVEVVQLVASGMCFGVALVWLIARLRGKPIE
jgi:hypothetical protein